MRIVKAELDTIAKEMAAAKIMAKDKGFKGKGPKDSKCFRATPGGFRATLGDQGDLEITTGKFSDTLIEVAGAADSFTNCLRKKALEGAGASDERAVALAAAASAAAVAVAEAGPPALAALEPPAPPQASAAAVAVAVAGPP